MYLPSLTALRAFHAAARLGSLTAAARELAVTTSAVSRQIKNLEECTGVPLIIRQGRGIRLTEEGRAFSGDLSDAFGQIDEAIDRIRRPVRGERLRITSTPNFASTRLIPRLDRFKARRPEIDVILIDSLDEVGGSTPDQIVIDWGTFEDDATTIAARLTDTEEMFPLCRPDACPGPGLAGATLLEADVVGRKWNWLDWQTFLAEVGLGDVETGDTYTMNPRLMFEATRQGKGIMLANTTIAEEEIAAGRFVRPIPESVTVEHSYWILIPRSERESPHIGAFVDWLREELAGRSRKIF